MNRETVLIAEDEEDIRNIMTLYLKREYNVLSFANGEEALAGIRETKPDIVLLDILLPGMNGYKICEQLRAEKIHIPVLFLSAKREQSDKIRGLELGADDYMTKPFDPGELMARVKALLRRSKKQMELKENRINLIKHGDLVIDTNRYVVTISGEPIRLSTKEMQLLILLATNPQRIYSTEQLYDLIWGEDNYGDLKTVSVHISTLRKKIEKNPSKPMYIITLRGFGYKFLE
ncbi:DNA-binding response OmpR family regulator [Cytobacillus eiseniae]|uniref:DNA-binding response OmpR family regulator n=1 Tax=Cytobacillus eiseniae TaxID=762947 RepID=A0ABS4R9G6_9BACI|nr:response regulator transcription factor [Cytobacillus eiseniae]MBP2239536.1 DNA-binding response OmpR family regulator [Cytobacillus eiseniae]